MTEGRPGPFFRGGELRGLIVFVVLVAVGWPVILNYARPRAAPPEPPPPADPRPLEPDTSLAFRGLVDRTPIGVRDNAAYKALLDRARETPPEKLGKDARRDVLFTNLWERPDLYRGVPIHLEGILKKVVSHEKVNPVFSAKGKLIDAWFVTTESRPLPYVVAVEDVPPGLPAGVELSERIAVDAYFLKVYRYTAGDAGAAAARRCSWAGSAASRPTARRSPPGPPPRPRTPARGAGTSRSSPCSGRWASTWRSAWPSRSAESWARRRDDRAPSPTTARPKRSPPRPSPTGSRTSPTRTATRARVDPRSAARGPPPDRGPPGPVPHGSRTAANQKRLLALFGAPTPVPGPTTTLALRVGNERLRGADGWKTPRFSPILSIR